MLWSGFPPGTPSSAWGLITLRLSSEISQRKQRWGHFAQAELCVRSVWKTASWRLATVLVRLDHLFTSIFAYPLPKKRERIKREMREVMGSCLQLTVVIATLLERSFHCCCELTSHWLSELLQRHSALPCWQLQGVWQAWQNSTTIISILVWKFFAVAWSASCHAASG